MIVVIGGGISGLSAAYELKKAGEEFILLEQAQTVGGKIQSIHKDYFLLEQGPNTVLINNKETKELIEELGLWDQLIFPEEKAVKSRFVLKNGKIEAIPNSLSSAIKSKLVGFSTLASILSEPFKPKKEERTEESLADFCRRRLGNQIFEDFVVPFITGIYAGDPQKMSVEHTFPLLVEAERSYGSILKGMPKLMKARKAENEKHQIPKQKIFSFKKGLGQLIESIRAEIDEQLVLGAEIDQIISTNGAYEISYTKEQEVHHIKADQIIWAVPAYVLARKISTLAPTLSNQLKHINYAPAISLHLSIPTDQLQFQEAAFGILSRAQEKVPFLGVLLNSRFFPHTAPAGKELITVICGGLRHPQMIDQEEKTIIEEVSNSLTQLLGARTEFDLLQIRKWPKGIPQYELGYGAIKESIEDFLEKHPTFKIAANFYQGVSVSDCIKNGKTAAREILN